MKKGGVIFNVQSINILRAIALVVPIVLTLYGALIQSGVVDQTNYTSDSVYFLIIGSWIMFGSLSFLFPSKKLTSSFIQLAIYHVLAVLYILFVCGLSSPFVFLWILLMLATYIIAGDSGLRLNIMTLFAVVAADLILNYQAIGQSLLMTDTVVLICIMAIGTGVIAIAKALQVDLNKLAITEASESLQRDRVTTIINNLTDAVISSDRSGTIRMYNAACLSLLDTNDDLVNKNIDKILPVTDGDDQPVLFSELLREAKTATLRDDLYYKFEDGETIRLEVTFAPIRSSYSRSARGEAEEGYVAILRDVTKTKSLEEERDEFISVVSHELRTPITITEGTLSNLQLMRQRGTTEDEVMDKAIGDAYKQVLYLAGMVNDLSTLSRAERGIADAPEIIDVRELINDTFNQYQPEAEAKGLHLDLDADTKLGHVKTSRLYLSELLQNFVTNSIKYTKKGSVTITAHLKAGQVTFGVQDTGIGMSKTDQKNIFNKFYRSEDYRTRETSGTGLGLYVSAKLARKIGTKIELKSRLNHGSTFSFHLPSAPKDKAE